MATPRPYGKGPYGRGPYGPGLTIIEVGGVCVVSFDAHGALGMAWRQAAGCNAGAWLQQDCAAGAWAPVDGCGTGAWTVTRLPELEPA
jgi:hypothetical protein